MMLLTGEMVLVPTIGLILGVTDTTRNHVQGPAKQLVEGGLRRLVLVSQTDDLHLVTIEQMVHRLLTQLRSKVSLEHILYCAETWVTTVVKGGRKILVPADGETVGSHVQKEGGSEVTSRVSRYAAGLLYMASSGRMDMCSMWE